MGKRNILFVVLSAFVVGVLAALSFLFVFQKRYEDADSSESDYMGTVVLDGFEIKIPNKNMAAIVEGVGLSYCDEGSFEMGISVVDGSYDETLNELDSLDRDIGEWFKLKKPFEEIAIDGRSYFYCVYEDEGETILLAYKKADEERSFEIMVRCLVIDLMKYQTEKELIREYESFILIADSLLKDVEPTNAENTPVGKTFVADDMYSKLQVELPEEFSPKGALYDESGNKLVGYQVEENFYMIAQEINPHYYSMKVYSNEDRDIKTVISVSDFEKSDLDAEKMMLEGSEDWTDSLAEVQSTDINGKTVYYYTYTDTYMYMGEELEKYYFEAAVDLDSGAIYRISASSMENSEVAQINTYTRFLLLD